MGNGVILGQTQIASTVPYDNTQTSSIITGDNVQEAIDQLFTSVSNGKSLVAGAITDKGISTSANATFQQMADNITAIETGYDTSDATAGTAQILSPYTAYGANGKITGSILSQQAKTIIPGTTQQIAIPSGTYAAGTVTVSGDSNLVADNIKEGVSIFGVTGSFMGGGTVVETASIVITGYSSRNYLEVDYTDASLTLQNLKVTGYTTLTVLKNSVIGYFNNGGGIPSFSGEVSGQSGHFALVEGDGTISA